MSETEKTKGVWCTLTRGPHAGLTYCLWCHRTRETFLDPDPCLGKLPGVVNACCGHGKEKGYIIFENGMSFQFAPQDVFKLVSAHGKPIKSFDCVSLEEEKVKLVPMNTIPDKPRKPNEDGSIQLFGPVDASSDC